MLLLGQPIIDYSSFYYILYFLSSVIFVIKNRNVKKGNKSIYQVTKKPFF